MALFEDINLIPLAESKKNITGIRVGFVRVGLTLVVALRFLVRTIKSFVFITILQISSVEHV